MNEIIHILFLLRSLFFRMVLFSFGIFQEHETFWIGKMLFNEIE